MDQKEESTSNLHQSFQYGGQDGDFTVDRSAFDKMKQLADEYNIDVGESRMSTQNGSSQFRTQSGRDSSDLIGEEFAGNQTMEDMMKRGQNGGASSRSQFESLGMPRIESHSSRFESSESHESPEFESMLKESQATSGQSKGSEELEELERSGESKEQTTSHESSRSESHGASQVESGKPHQSYESRVESSESQNEPQTSEVETSKSSQDKSQAESSEPQHQSHESSQEVRESSQAESSEPSRESQVKSSESQNTTQETSQDQTNETSQSKTIESSQAESGESQTTTNETSKGEEATNQSSWSIPEDEVKSSANRRFFRMTSSGLNRSPSSRYKHGTSSYQGSDYGDTVRTPTKTHSRSVSGSNWLTLSSQTEHTGESSNREESQEESSREESTREVSSQQESSRKESSRQESSRKEFNQESSRKESNREESSSRTITQDQYNSGYGTSIPDSPPTYSQGSTYKHQRDESPDASERTPLLDQPSEPQDGDLNPTKKKNRLPSAIALGFLVVLVILAIVFGFAAPAAVEEFAKEAMVFDPKGISIDSFTETGIRTRVQGTLWLDGSKVQKKSVRDLGRAATWIAKEVESGEASVAIHVPHYDDMLLGTVMIPPVKLNIRDGHKNDIDIYAELEPGQASAIQKIANDFMDGVRTLDVKAIVTVPVKSGLINLGQKVITENVHLHANSTPKVPKFDIVDLQVSEFGIPSRPHGVRAKAKVIAFNDYPVKFDVPPLAMEVLLPDCEDSYLMLGEMNTRVVHVLPKQNVTASVIGTVRQLQSSLTHTCPGSNKSPLDYFIGKYLGGNDTTVYVRGGEQGPETPMWIGNLLRQMVVPVPVPVRPFDNSIKNFTLSDVNFKLPDLPESNPTLSATIEVVVGLPKDINIEVGVNRVRSDGMVYFHGKTLGKLDLHKWQKANSTKIGSDLHVQSEVVDAPLQIVDQQVFTEVIQSLIFHHSGIELGMKASVDVDTTTALGEFIVRDIPAKGDIFIKPIGGNQSFEHNVTDISVVGSTTDELILQANVSVKNPTEYSAHVPYVNISVWCNNTELGYAWGSFDVRPGINDLSVKASWSTGAVGAEFLSQYISGANSSIEMRTHPGSIPGLPDPQIALNVTVPHLFGKFLKETTMHILTSTATFVLFSPLPMSVTNISAHAYYNGTEIGIIDYADPFAIVPGDNDTPRLPVSWNTNGGYGLVRDALGGSLKLDAHADVGVRIGEWEAVIWYEAKGLGAKVRF